ncbi:multidrug effflux MFS transporter [Leifsonia sp. NPDC058194]|uniref:multidrug effflux MFS transporter n=1 Tax=Leifsonia sp. NPDC058194 TaxID=3346374 RepID=UPI0036DD0731
MKREREPLLIVLIGLAGIGPFATDMYLSGLPHIAEELSTTPTFVQLTFTTFLIGFALGQLVWGPLSDGQGRKVFLISGSLAFAVLSVVCSVIQDPISFAIVRFLQGGAAAAGVVLARAVISDRYTRAQAGSKFALIAAVTSLGPVLAPVLGGLILTVSSWRVIFLMLAAVGILLAVGSLFGVPETLPPERRTGSGLRANATRIRSLLTDARFMGFVITGCLVSGGLLTYVVGSSFALQEVFGVSAGFYTVIFAVNSLGLVISSLVFSRLIATVRVRTLLATGLGIAASASTALAALAALGVATLPVTWTCLFVMVLGMGFVNPGFITLAQRAGHEHPGTAAALQGGTQFLFGALVTPVSGLLGYTAILPQALLIAGFMVSAFAVNRVLARRQRDRMGELD